MSKPLTVQLLLSRSPDHKVLGRGLAPDEVHGAEVALLGHGVDPRHHRLHEEGPEAALVEHVGQHGGEGRRLHLAALAELVHL